MPSDISVDFSGVLSRFIYIGSAVEREVLNALDEAAGHVADAAKLGHPVLPEELRGSMSPSVVDPYREINTGGTSFDGTYRFLSRTGITRNSIIPQRATNNGGVLSSKVVSGVQQSNDLEFGTVDRRAFPFMRPALEYMRPWIQDRLELAVQRGLEG
jgi:hypothetical protein